MKPDDVASRRKAQIPKFEFLRDIQLNLSMFGPLDDLFLMVGVQIHKIVAVASHTDQ